MLIADTTEIFSLLRQGGEIYVHERQQTHVYKDL